MSFFVILCFFTFFHSSRPLTDLCSTIPGLRLTPCVGDGDRNSLDLDPVDADRLNRLSCRGELRRVQRYHPPCRSNFRQSPLLPSPRERPLRAGRWRGGGGDDRGGGCRCRGNRVLELNRLPLARRCFEEDLREENAKRTSEV